MGMRELVCKIINNNPSNKKKIIEIGIWKGELSRKLINECNFKNLFLIDPLSEDVNNFTYKTVDEQPTIMKKDHYRCGSSETIKDYDMWANSLNNFIENSKKKDKISFIRKKSEEVFHLFDDNDIDFIYIDAIHLYENVVSDVKNYLPKVKYEGIIFGDDYSKHFPGVINAINDVFEGVDLVIHKNEGVWMHKVTKESKQKIESNIENALINIEKENKK